MLEHQKDFDGWNQRKKKLHQGRKDVYFNEREIWWCSTGLNVGYEQDGKGDRFCRPIVIVKKFNRHLFVGLPLTSQVKRGRFYFPIGIVSGRSALAVLSQPRALSSKRLINKVGMVDEQIFLEMKRAASDCVFGVSNLSPSFAKILTVVPEGEAEAHYVHNSTP